MKRQVLLSVTMIALLALTLGAPLASAQSEQPSEPGLVIVRVDADGPAAKADVRRGDILLAIDGQSIDQPADWFRAMRSLAADEAVELQVLHGDDQRTLTATVAQRNSRAFLGLQVYLGGAEDTAQDEPLMLPLLTASAGASIVEVVEDSPASAAGLQPGDLITAVDGVALDAETSLADLIGGYKPGDEVTLTVTRADSDGEGQELAVVLGENPDDATRPFLGVRYTSAPDLGLPEGHDLPFFGQSGDELPFELPFGQTTPDGQTTPELQTIAGGALVRTVTEDSPAAEAGLLEGDVITAVDGVAVDSPQALVDALTEHKPGDTVLLTVTRADADEDVEVEATLGEHPDDAERAYLGVSVSNVTLPQRGMRQGQGGFRLPFDLDQLPFDLDQLPFDLEQLPFDLDQLPFDLPVQPQPDGPQA
jgi:S1-C subfamily serine protease